MKKWLYLTFLLHCTLTVFATQTTDSLLNALDKTIEMRQVYIQEKLQRIGSFQRLHAQNAPRKDLPGKLNIYNELYNEYKTFIYDSSFCYANKILAIAYQLKEPEQINDAKLKVGFTLLSAGMFKETLDTLKTIDPIQMPDSSRGEYYGLMGRAYYDLADYSQDQYYSPRYHEQGNQYLKMALALSKPQTKEHYLLAGGYNLRKPDLKKAIANYEYLLKNFKLSSNQYAIATSSLSACYPTQSKPAIDWLIKAAIADIKASTRETVAIRRLAELIHKQGDTQRAFRYVKVALDDADFYGARHRKVQISDILPIIEETQLASVEGQKKVLLSYSVILTLLLVLIILFAIIIFRQYTTLKKAKTSLAKSNQHLQEINSHLQEVNRIKEEYIGHFFNNISEYIEKIDKFKKAINRKLTSKKMEEIGEIINNINPHKEREELYLSFDHIFLKIFPDFLQQFNAFFKPEDHLSLRGNQALTPELRIFALIRLGIKDTEKIAKFLDYSVNTIYTYKTRIKNRSVIPNEKFEERLMEIKAD